MSHPNRLHTSSSHVTSSYLWGEPNDASLDKVHDCMFEDSNLHACKIQTSAYPRDMPDLDVTCMLTSEWP